MEWVEQRKYFSIFLPLGLSRSGMGKRKKKHVSTAHGTSLRAHLTVGICTREKKKIGLKEKIMTK